jgi:hypothetical protein
MEWAQDYLREELYNMPDNCLDKVLVTSAVWTTQYHDVSVRFEDTAAHTHMDSMTTYTLVGTVNNSIERDRDTIK